MGLLSFLASLTKEPEKKALRPQEFRPVEYKESKRVIDRGGYDLNREHHSFDSGDGFICKDIARQIGVLNVSNEEPNKNLVKWMAEQLRLKPVGEITGEISNQSNGSMWGCHPYVKYKYSKDQAYIIKTAIKQRMVKFRGSIWCVGTKKFRFSKDF